MPVPIPIPESCPEVTAASPQKITVDGSAPAVFKYVVTPVLGIFGRNVTFNVGCDSPCNAGIYGPNPQSIGGAGRMRAPKTGAPDGSVVTCQGNFTPGTYYIVVRAGNGNAPAGAVRAWVKESAWKWW